MARKTCLAKWLLREEKGKKMEKKKRRGIKVLRRRRQ